LQKTYKSPKNSVFQILIFLAILLFLIRPIITQKTGNYQYPQLNIIIDNTESMQINQITKQPLIKISDEIYDEIKKQYAGKINLLKFDNSLNDYEITLAEQENNNIKNLIISDFNFNIPQTFNNRNSYFFHIFDETMTNLINLQNIEYEQSENNYNFKLKISVLSAGEYTLTIEDLKTKKNINSKKLKFNKIGNFEIDYQFQKNINSAQFLKFSVQSSAKAEDILIDNHLIAALPDTSKKNKVLVICNIPDWDFAFFNRNLNSLKALEIDYYYQNLPDINKQLKDYQKNYDLLILFKPNFSKITNFLKSIILESGAFKIKKILYFTGTNKNIVSQDLLNLLNLKLNNPPILENKIITAEHSINSFIMPFIDWQNLPPLDKMLNLTIINNPYIVRLQTINDSAPILIQQQNSDNLISIIFTGSGFYKWEFFSGLFNNDNIIFKTFWCNIIDYLLTHNQPDELKITGNPSNLIFHKFDNVNLELSRSDFIKKNSANLKILHYFDNDSSYIDISKTNKIPTDKIGMNTLSAKFKFQNKDASDKFEYYVDNRITEKNIFDSENIKNSLSEKNNYFTLKMRGYFVENINNIIKPVENLKTFDITHNFYYLIFIIMLFSINWFLLKK